MANGHGGVFVQQQHRHGLAHNVAASHDDGVLAGDRDAAALEDLNHPGRRARRDDGLPADQPARVYRMESITSFSGTTASSSALVST